MDHAAAPARGRAAWGSPIWPSGRAPPWCTCAATMLPTERAPAIGQRRRARRRSAPGSSSTRTATCVTNEHVVRGVTDLRVRLYDGRELPACVVGADAPTDIALLKVDAERAAAGAAARRLGRRARRRAGGRDRQPLRLQPQRHRRDRLGQGAGRRSRRRCTTRRQQEIYSFFIQTDASINLGNSGGPLIDATGAVIGVNAAFWAGHPLQPAQGIGFAIPINMAKSLLPRLREKGDAPRAYLGVDAQPIDSALEVALKLPSTRGALIASVEQGSPAEAGGLEPGDVVVTWNGTPRRHQRGFQDRRAAQRARHARQGRRCCATASGRPRGDVPRGATGRRRRAAAPVELLAARASRDGQHVRRLRGRRGPAGAGARPARRARRRRSRS